jgi:hypothetical protein
MKKKEIPVKRGLTIVTRGVLYLMGFAVISICVILLPELAREEAVANPNAGPAVPFLIGAWVLSVPIFVALHHTLRLLSYIDTDKAFSVLSVKALQNIKMCAIAFSAMIVFGAITVIVMARISDPREDVTHILTLGFIFTFAASIVATFAAVLKRLLQDAINIKTENDLIV